MSRRSIPRASGNTQRSRRGPGGPRRPGSTRARAIRHCPQSACQGKRYLSNRTPRKGARREPRSGVRTSAFPDLGPDSLRVVLVLKAFAHHVRPYILEQSELVPARILEEQARTRRDLERATFGFPPAGPEFLGFRLQVLDLEKGQDRRRRPMVGQQILGALAYTEGGDLRSEGVLIPQHVRA